MAGCGKHLFDQAVATCGRCRVDYCADCLVYPFGQRKPPLCLTCALEAAGVRRGGRARSVTTAGA